MPWQKIVDPGGGDGFLVGVNRILMGILDRVEQHLDIDALGGHLAQRVEYGWPLEFVDRDAQTKAGPGCLLDEGDD